MKSSLKIKTLILMIIGIILAFSSISMINIEFIEGNNDDRSDYSEDFILDNDKLKLSAISGKIHIINNSGWVDFRNDGDCTGSGTYTNPYIIEDLVIDGGGSGSCTLIENSDIYFKIENCYVLNSGDHPDAGIRLSYVNNSQLIDNNCSSNGEHGIRLFHSHYNNISGNTADDHKYSGIELMLSHYNNISENTAKSNNNGINIRYSNYNNILGNTAKFNGDGISLAFSHYNNISRNTATFNSYGITLYKSNFSTISGNMLRGNDYCIQEEYCEGNIFKNNDCVEDWIPSYNPFFLLGILSAVTVILINKIKKF